MPKNSFYKTKTQFSRSFSLSIQSTEEALRVSSAQHSNASQEANVATESLTKTVSTLSDQRDQLLDQLGKVTRDYERQCKDMENLTMVLEGFQREKDNHLKLAKKDFEERFVHFLFFLRHIFPT